MRKTKIDVYDAASWLYHELLENGIKFNSDGYPIFRPEFILWQKPNYILPFNHRNAAPVKAETVVCYFMNDKLLYRRLSKLKKDIKSLSEYLGICGFDLSPRIGWDDDLQKFNILLSQMVTIWIALQGIKVIPNFRTGNYSTISSLNSYEQNIPVVIGALGCWKRKLSVSNEVLFKLKLLKLNPSVIFIYGKLEEELLKEIQESGIQYYEYLDFRTICLSKR